jgi:hypothetical protein
MLPLPAGLRKLMWLVTPILLVDRARSRCMSERSGVRFVWLAALASLLLVLAPSSATAAFPGANGLLAVQPRTGGGIVLVAASGRAARRICVIGAGCGSPRRPRWSPDGRSLVFAGPAVRVIYSDGSCVNCRFGVAVNPAFGPSGTVISFVDGRHVEVDGIDGIRERSPVSGAASDAVWSASGWLAVVRRGVIWAGRPGRLRQLGVGGAPSWSPEGARVAAVRRGWIVLIAVRDGRVRRLVRGSAPAFSPDGRWVAYVAPDGRLMIIRAAAGHPAPRAVGNVRAVSVDWQPRPSGPRPACAAPPRSTVLASSPAAVIWGEGELHPGPIRARAAAYMGCLRADGRERLLERLTPFVGYYVLFVDSALLAAPYAGLVLENLNSHDADQSEILQVFDLRTGRLETRLGGESASCDIGPPCLDHVVLGSDGVSAAHEWLGAIGIGLSTNVSCAPATTTCVAVDDLGHMFSSTDPTAGAQPWTVTTFPGGSLSPSGPAVIDCPSSSLCVGARGTTIYTSTDPTAGPSTWTATVLAGAPFETVNDLTCVSVHLCLVTRTDSIASSTNPTGSQSAWTIAEFPSSFVPAAVFCSSQPECFVADSEERTVMTSADPTGGTRAWTLSTSVPPFTSGTCPTTSLCIAVNDGYAHNVHNAQITTNPSAGSWSTVAAADTFGSIVCPSASLCLATTDTGALDVSTNPASGPWTHIAAGPPLVQIACASASLCIGADNAGELVSSTNPTGGPAAWIPVPVNPCANTCTLEQIEASDATGLHAVDTSELPGPGPFLTGPTLTGDVLSWSDNGTPRSLTLTP